MRALALALAGALVVACGGGASNPSPPPTRPGATLPYPPTGTAPTPRTPSPSVACATASQTGPATKATILLVKGGAIVIQLRPDKAPGTVANFAKRARACQYDGLTFHRVVLTPTPFVVQGGDPKGDGTGGGTQPTELSDLPFLKGALGVARGQDVAVSNDAQFFICIGNCRHLDGQYTNFGQVTSGQEVADAVRMGDKILTIRIE